MFMAMAAQKVLVILLCVLIVLTCTANSASIHKRATSNDWYDSANDLMETDKSSRALELKHDLKRLLEILLLDELEQNDDKAAEDRRGAPRPGR